MKKDNRVFEFYSDGVLKNTRPLYPKTNSDVIRICNNLNINESHNYVDIHTGYKWMVKRIK